MVTCLISVQVNQPDRNDPNVMRSDYLTPCSPGAPGATEMNWMDIEPDLLFEPYVSMQVPFHWLEERFC